MGAPYRFLLRMPAELRDPLRAAAERNGRSLNAEIVARLEESVGGAEPAGRRGRAARLLPLAAAVAVVAAGGVGGFALAPGPASEASDGPPVSKSLLLGDPPGSSQPTR